MSSSQFIAWADGFWANASAVTYPQSYLSGRTDVFYDPEVPVTLIGSGGIERVFAAPGSKINASILGGAIDLVFLRGRWSDYEKNTVDNSSITFSRSVNVNGNLLAETVKVAKGTPFGFDRLVFADGAVATFSAHAALRANPSVALASITSYDPNLATPAYESSWVWSPGFWEEQVVQPVVERAGGSKGRKRFAPWLWMPPLPPVRRPRKKREAELMAFLGP